MSEKKCIIHIFPRSIFLRYYMSLLEAHFDTEEHVFILVGKDHSTTLPYPDCYSKFQVIEIETKFNLFDFHTFLSPNISMTLKKSDLIIFHCFPSLLLNFMLLHPKILKKSAWVVWGHDIDDYRPRNNHFLSRCYFDFYYVIKKMVTLQIPYVVAREPEYEIIKKYYNSKAARYSVMNLYPPIYSLPPKKTCSDNHVINILIGHSAFEADNQLEILGKLLRFKNEMVHFYLPLSYGNSKYASIVRDYANLLYGDKVSILSTTSPLDQYIIFLNNIDIGILDAQHQFGLGTICHLLHLGKKVFLNDIGLNKQIFDELGCTTFLSSTLTSCSFQELIHMDESVREMNKVLSSHTLDINTSVSQWSAVFELASSINNK